MKDQQDRTNGNVPNAPLRDSDTVPYGLVSALTRRRFLGSASIGAAAMATTAGCALPGEADQAAETEAVPVGALNAQERRLRAFAIRQQAALRNLRLPLPVHRTNGDEDRFPSRIGNFSKGLPHDAATGEVDPAAYQALLQALRTGRFQDFEAVPLGGRRRLVNPQGGLAFDLEGLDCQQNSMPPPPGLGSAEIEAEAVELYWMALLRDVGFGEYAGHPLAQAAAAELSRLPGFAGPREGGAVTPQTLFRDNLPGATVGPYLSQFMYRFTPFGTELVERRQRTLLPAQEFMVDPAEFLALQNGTPPAAPPRFDPMRRHLRNGRDLSAWVREDILFQGYFNAALIMLAAPGNLMDPVFGQQGGVGAPLDETNPYRMARAQDPFATFGGPYILTTMCELSTRALKAVWFHKWFVHRRLRPEEYGGLVHRRAALGRDYPVGGTVLESEALQRSFEKFGSHLLPMAVPEGSPIHPSYGAGHAVVAGACVTLLKAFFEENTVLANPVVASADGLSLVPFEGPPLTIGGELNKLASNVSTGRNIAGLHWRTDAVGGLALGEQVAISILRDHRLTYPEPFGGFSFTRFDGTPITI